MSDHNIERETNLPNGLDEIISGFLHVRLDVLKSMFLVYYFSFDPMFLYGSVGIKE